MKDSNLPTRQEGFGIFKRLSGKCHARLADIPYTTITKIEPGVIKRPSVQGVAKIAKVLDVSIEKLID